MRITISAAAALLIEIAASAQVDSPTLLPLGDSITYGCGSDALPGESEGCDPDSGGYRIGLLSSLAAVGGSWANVSSVGTVVMQGPRFAPPMWLRHAGTPGARIDQIDDARVPAGPGTPGWLSTKPDIITLHAGTNDCYQNYQPAVLAQKMELLLNHTYAALPKTHVFLASILLMPTCQTCQANCAERYNSMLPAIVERFVARNFSITYVPMAETTGLCVDVGADAALCCAAKVHPNAAGYLRMASAFAISILTHYNATAATASVVSIINSLGAHLASVLT